MTTPADTPTVIATVIRTTDPNSPEFPSYAVTTTDGRTFAVRKEFYADGPSMFTWTVTDASGHDGHLGEATTKRRALDLIAALPSPASAFKPAAVEEQR